MNRIILIGNGFDLAHGLKTSYADFIRGYYFTLKLRLLEGEYELIDGLCSVEISNSEDRKLMEKFRWMLSNNMFRYVNNVGEITMTERYDTFFNDHFKYESRFFEAINKAIETKSWVDIEAVYYHWLTKIFKQDECEYADPNKLNDELKILEENLVVYLAYIQAKFIKPELVKDCIRQIIYEPFNPNDISNSENAKFEQFLINRLEYIFTKNEYEIRYFLSRFGWEYLYNHSDIDNYGESVVVESKDSEKTKSFDFIKHIQNVNKQRSIVPDCFLWPDQILLLNFNYTKTADLYLTKGSEFKVNHIHGELGNEKNPIIFGYGDELDDDYKAIAKLNDNDYLKNIKSICYLETDNYRKLLSFIDSAPFQIYIMGHSCGISDRTLLNTLFEHKNCVSIKPFYYEKPDGTDNYIEIVQNISRNFNDMRLMRDRVVNKTYCRPMMEVTTE